MGKFYSDALEEGIRLLYFQADPAKFPQGVSLLEAAVETGEPDAYYFLARCYAWGDGNVKEDIRKAKELSRKGIELGSALCVLGVDRMNELKGDIKDAMTHSLKEYFDQVLAVAKAGEPMAQYAIGLFYFWGDMLVGIQKPYGKDYDRIKQENAEEAIKWFRLSAEQGCIPAFRNAFNGVRGGINDVKKDVKDALRWLETVRDKVDLRDYYSAVIQEYKTLKDDKYVSRWCRRGVEDGDQYSIVELGLIYLSGNKEIAMDEKEALRLFERAARDGNEYGYYNLGRCYYNGWGCTRDYQKAVANFEQARSMGHTTAANFLARCYYWGRGVYEDPVTAFKLAKAQQDAKRSFPKEILGLCYLYGKGTPVDYELAKTLLEESAADYTVSCYGLGLMYDKGLGVQEDVAKAVSYYEKAAAGGNPDAGKAMEHFKKTIFGKWKRK